MVSRRRARQRALEVLYSADIRGRLASDVLRHGESEDEPVDKFTEDLVRGVENARDDLDALIAGYARDWTLERMPVVDRNILRLAVYELQHTDVPPAVAINEAVELARDLSTDDSGRYVNGILSRVVGDAAPHDAAPDDVPPHDVPPDDVPPDDPEGQTPPQAQDRAAGPRRR